MMQPSQNNTTLPAGGACPGDEPLLALVEGRLPEPDQAPLVEHLDSCSPCRTRLEELAGGDEFCFHMVRNLRESAVDDQDQSQHLIALMRAQTRLADNTRAVSDEEPSLDFLAPCEKPDRLGRLDRYEILEVLGRGGMGLVLKAYDPSLDRLVAIKVLASPLTLGPKARARFRREARVAAALRSQHTVTIHAVEETAKLPYLVMEHVPGSSLQERIEDGGVVELDDVLRIGAQIARGLAAAHAKGLIHRDVKPANILLEEGTGVAKITDFGLARAMDDAALTRAGTLAGTPEYMAPEQAASGPVDHRADLFSLGSVLYAMCTGQPPFRAEGSLAVLECVRQQTPPPIRDLRPDVPEPLVQIIEKLHCKDPAGRYASAVEVAEALEEFAANSQATPGDVAPESTPAPADPAPPVGSGRKRNRAGWLVLAASLLVAISFGVSEVTGFSEIVARTATLLRFRTPHGTLIVEVEDPAVEVTVDSGTGELVVTGAGIHELRVRAGEHRIQAQRDGKPILDEVITIIRDGRKVVAVRQEPSSADVAKPDRAAPADRRITSSVATAASPPMAAPPPAAPDAAVADTPPTDLAGPPRDPIRVRILRPDALLQEAIRAEKDQLPEPPSPYLLRKLEGHTGPVTAVAFSPDGKTILSCSGWPKGDRTVRLWDVDAGSEIRRFQTDAVPPNPGISGPREAPREFMDLAFAADGTQAVTASTGGAVCVWDVKTGTILRQFEDHQGTVYGVAVSRDAPRALTGGRDSTARLWDIETGEEVLCLSGHNSWVRCVAISPDGWSALTGGYDNTMRLWDLETGRELQQFKAGNQWVWSVAFSPTGRRAISASGNLIHLWDLEEGKPLRSFKGHAAGVTCVAFSPNGRRILSASYDGSVRLWDVEKGEELQAFLGCRDHVWSVAFSPNGRLAASGGGGRHSATGDADPGIDFAIRLWKLP